MAIPDMRKKSGVTVCVILEFETELEVCLLFVCLFICLFLGRKPNRQNCLLKEVLREREEKKRKKRRKVIRW